MDAVNADRRYHSLDQLRAVMMMLGLVLHSAISFAVTPLENAWPYKDAGTNLFFDLVVLFIHVFRMPVFFAVAGFFAAYLYYRRGVRSMMRNRFARIVVPFAVFLPVLFVASRTCFTYSQAGGLVGGGEGAWAYLSRPSVWYTGMTTGHLWFLYYLIIIYAAMLFGVPILRRVWGSHSTRAIRTVGSLIHHPLGPLACIGVTFLTLLPMSYPALDHSSSFALQPKILVAYGVFVAFGWLLYLNREEVEGFSKRAWAHFGAGIVFFLAYSVFLVRYPYGSTDYPRLLGTALAASSMWLLIYGFTGLFVRYLDKPSPWGRYFSDASYWLYLIHLPFTALIPGLLSAFEWSPFLKSGITLAVTTGVTLLTYHFLVRSTVIGVLLNGRRYPRALPRYDEKGMYIQPVES
jgi:fucose 4-O-acetylase-like acetyltransferase